MTLWWVICFYQNWLLSSFAKDRGILIFEPCLNVAQTNGTGTLGLVEFKTLWMKIQKYLVT